MFFKPKQKLDSKVRFQNRSFKRQLQNARNYKRTPHRTPNSQGWAFFSNIGLGTIKTKILAVIIILLAIYVIYIPNFLYIKQINITGFKTEDQQKIKDLIKESLTQRRLWPQQNLLLLSKGKLSNDLLTYRQDVYKVISIKKDFPNTLTLELEQRISKYVLEVQEKRLLVSNDGKIMSELSSSTPANVLPILKLKYDLLPQIGGGYFDTSLLAKIDVLSRETPSILGSSITHFEMEKRIAPDLIVFTSSGLKVIFDVELDVRDSVKRLKLLWSNVAESDKGKLYYVDMRLANRGYVCFKNTPCTREVTITESSSLPTTSTTTLETIK